MSTYFLSAPVGKPPAAPRDPGPVLDTALESLDGTRRIPLDGSTGWTHLAGSTGLEMPPIDVATLPVPGVPGSVLQDVRVTERPIFIPILIDTVSTNHAIHLEALDAMRTLVDPLTGMFRIVGTTERGQRSLTAIYTGGLEGSDGRDERGLNWRKFGLTAVACQPFAEAREDRVVEFQNAGGGGGIFLGTAGGTNVPWPRALSSAAVIGDNMRVPVRSEVPVYPTVELVGPMESFTATVQLEDASLPPYFGGAAWSVSIPQGVPAGSTLRLVTDPRARSIRMDGQLAAGRVARGSTLRPFYPGVNLMSVAAPGGTEATRIRVSWRELYRSLW